jgi:hypothetical protein
MNEFSMAVSLDERHDRRCKERRVFSYTAFLPDRRVLPDRRCRLSLHLVELEDEEIASLLESSID